MFPGTPVEETKPAPPPAQDLLMRLATVRTMAEYSVGYADYPFAVEGTERAATFLTNVRDAGVKGTSSRLVEDRDEPFSSHPGRVYKVEFGGGYYLACRSFVVKNRLYMVMATTYGEKKAAPNVVQIYEDAADRFLESFRLLSAETEEKQAGNTGPAPAPSQEAAEGEVDRLLKTLRENGETVIRHAGDCLERGTCAPPPDVTASKSVVEMSRAVAMRQPEYPPIARAARASGTVGVRIVVDEGGKVIAAQADGGHPLLRTAAVQAAREWQFTPARLDGKPVKFVGRLSFTFNLR
jgi:TonB family protein